MDLSQRVDILEQQLGLLEQFFELVNTNLCIQNFNVSEMRNITGRWLFGADNWKILNKLFELLAERVESNSSTNSELTGLLTRSLLEYFNESLFNEHQDEKLLK